MEIEYLPGRVPSYVFNRWEKNLISSKLKLEVNRIERKIERVKKHPYNRGQEFYSKKITDLRLDIDQLNNIIKAFK